MAGVPTALSRRIVRLAAKQGVEWPGGEDNAYIQRTYAGRHQISAGALSWVLEPVKRDWATVYPQIGAYLPASDVRGDWDFGWDAHGYSFDPPVRGEG